MKILVIGSGGREHALVWKLSQSPLVSKIYCAPGNAGTALHAENVPIGSEDLDALLYFALKEKAEFVVVGPEAPLVAGIADLFIENGLLVFGPSAGAAQLEGSKIFTKELFQNHKIPTAASASFDEAPAARAYIKRAAFPLVIKADGLAAGKGVTIAANLREAEEAVVRIMEKRAYGDAGRRVLVEEFLKGEEVSLLCITDGKTVVPLPTAQDHKAVFDNDQGPNTGGMGAYSPAPLVPDSMVGALVDQIIRPTLLALRNEGIVYRGVLYAGLMMTADGPKVLEYNCRFGDPETQALLPRLTSDLFPVMKAASEGKLADVPPLQWTSDASVSVCMVSEGYPALYPKGLPITGIDDATKQSGVMVFHAGTATKENQLVTAGGRVLNVTALAPRIPDAIAKAYEAVEKIHFQGAHYRKDIGQKALKRLTPSQPAH